MVDKAKQEKIQAAFQLLCEEGILTSREEEKIRARLQRGFGQIIEVNSEGAAEEFKQNWIESYLSGIHKHHGY